MYFPKGFLVFFAIKFLLQSLLLFFGKNVLSDIDHDARDEQSKNRHSILYILRVSLRGIHTFGVASCSEF